MHEAVQPAHQVLTRRGFFAGAAVGVSALLIPGSIAHAGPVGAVYPIPKPVIDLLPPPMYVVPLGGARGEFLRRLLRVLSGAIDYAQVAQDVVRWFPWLTPSERTKVTSDHNDLLLRGYGDPRNAPDTQVFGNHGTSRKCVFYPVDSVSAAATSADGIVPFYDMCTCTCVAQLASPTIKGLEAATKDLLAAGNSQATVARCLVPDRNQTSRSDGVWSTDYEKKDSYKSADGHNVSVNYRRPSADIGEIEVIAVHDHLNGGRPLIHRTYTTRLG